MPQFKYFCYAMWQKKLVILSPHKNTEYKRYFQIKNLIRNQDVSAVKRLLDLGMSPNLKLIGELNILTMSILHINKNRPDITTLLIQRGADVNTKYRRHSLIDMVLRFMYSGGTYRQLHNMRSVVLELILSGSKRPAVSLSPKLYMFLTNGLSDTYKRILYVFLILGYGETVRDSMSFLLNNRETDYDVV